MKAKLAAFLLIAAAALLAWLYWPGVLSKGKLTLAGGLVYTVESDTGTVNLSHDKEQKVVTIHAGSHELRMAPDRLEVDGKSIDGFAFEPEVKAVAIRIQDGVLSVRTGDELRYEGRMQ